MERQLAVNTKHEFYVSLPNLRWAIRKSEHEYKWAVIARDRKVGEDWSDWYVARWSSSHELANKHASHLETGCPAVKKHEREFETKVVPVEKFS